jgi:hypothetical protein
VFFAWKWRVLVVYLCLLLISFVVRLRAPREPIAPDVQVMFVPALRGEQTTNQTVRLAYREYVCENSREAPVVVLLHGSPGNHRDFQKLAPELATQYRVIVPDLPGFGSSSHSIPDYSTRAHARYVLELLDQLQTLFFKFTAAKESVYIFSALGAEPWGGIGSGVVELIASLLLLVPRTVVFGAILTLGYNLGRRLRAPYETRSHNTCR